MELWNTYYYLTRETDHTGEAKDTRLTRRDGSLIAMVSARFARDFCIEGSGLLEDGRVINFGGSCPGGYVCYMGGPTCYVTLDPARFPWGKGAGNRVLVPMRSIAVDRNVIPLGSRVYVPRFAGLAIPRVDGLGGTTHDGWFSADDVGGAIQGNHVDIFAGTRGMYRALERIVPTRSNLTGVVVTRPDGTVLRDLSPSLGGSSAWIWAAALGAGAAAAYAYREPIAAYVRRATRRRR